MSLQPQPFDVGSGSPTPDPELRLVPGHPDTLVSLQGVWRYWGRGDRRWPVLRGVDLRLAPGTVTIVSGANGAGKTTLLRIISGILAPDDGTVRIRGISPLDSWREYHRGIGFLSAGDRGLYARLTVHHHLEHAARLAFVPRRERRATVRDSLGKFELSALASRRADRLSLGQRQRLRLAIAVIHDPRVLLLDEPRNSLDHGGLQLLEGGVRRVVERGGAVLCCGPLGEDHLDDYDQRAVIQDGVLSWR